ncbi:alpha/beta fold hydrolase [Agrobacterium vitis]|nr:alpha/beta hydrolase [Agrobacterium vitis]WEO75348.1 alpha/beta hydrolase [Agrobacterium vitis]
MKSLAGATFLASIALSTGAAAAADSKVRNVVLVHGAFADGSGWRAVADLLAKDGYKVSIVQQPETTLEADVQATQRVLDQQDGPVVLVGHSYGGQIITEAGSDPKVRSLIYVSALMPEIGDSLLSLVKSKPLPNEDVKATKDGYLYLDPAKFAADFAADLPKEISATMAISQVFVSEKAFSTPVTRAPWHDKPTFAIVSTQDKALNPDLERWMYKRAGAEVTEIEASHAVYISQPQAVVRVIEKAAESGK